MEIQKIAIETELSLIQITEKYFSGIRWQVESKLEPDWVEIDFKAYLTEAQCRERPYPNPCHPYRFWTERPLSRWGNPSRQVDWLKEESHTFKVWECQSGRLCDSGHTSFFRHQILYP